MALSALGVILNFSESSFDFNCGWWVDQCFDSLSLVIFVEDG
jgi:hypothetical protein